MNNVGFRIKSLRKNLNLTQKQFADRIMITQSYLSRVENGTEQPNEKLVKLIALEYNVPTDWLEDGKGSNILGKDFNDYFDRGNNKIRQKEMQKQLEELSIYLKEQKNEVINSYVSTIISEMLSFLKSISNEAQGIQTTTFEKIASAVMELFIQLQKLSTNIKPEAFNSIAWISTSTLTESFEELREIYFNSKLFLYPDD